MVLTLPCSPKKGFYEKGNRKSNDTTGTAYGG